MLESPQTGRSKLSAATQAVGAFLSRLKFSDGDRAAVVAFNRDVYVLQSLTGDSDSLDQALDGLEGVVSQQTRIHLGVDAARAELPPSIPDRKTVMIVLTDGRSNPDPARRGGEAAQAAHRDGIEVFPIGLGSELDIAALEAMASDADHFFWAPDGEDLERIYRSIVELLPCPADQFWGRRC